MAVVVVVVVVVEALTLSKCRLDFSRCFSTIDGVFNLNGSDIGKVSVNIELVDECRCGGVDSSRGVVVVVVVVVGLEPWRYVVVDIIVGVCVGDAAMCIIGVCVDNGVLLDATQDGMCLKLEIGKPLLTLKSSRRCCNENPSGCCCCCCF